MSQHYYVHSPESVPPVGAQKSDVIGRFEPHVIAYLGELGIEDPHNAPDEVVIPAMTADMQDRPLPSVLPTDMLAEHLKKLTSSN